MGLIESIERVLAAIRTEFAVDPRTSIFDVDLVEDGDALVVVGATSEPAAAEALQRRIGVLEVERPVRVEIARLPLEEVDEPHAVCTSSVAPMLASPCVSDAHVSQTVLGHRLLVYREYGRWLQCRSSDGYLGWVHRGYLRRMSEARARAWELGEDGVACVSLGAQLVAADGVGPIGLPWGARVVDLRDGRVRLPGGEVGRVEGELCPESEQERRFPAEGSRVVATAERWVGAPYVWGGVTPAGVDCSGLVQAVYRTHGIELPRDSDQQAGVGAVVEPGRGFGALEPGDLLYFSEEAVRISHVAISVGGSRIVHAAIGNGGVGFNDLCGDSHLEQELASLFVCARRVFPSG